MNFVYRTICTNLNFGNFFANAWNAHRLKVGKLNLFMIFFTTGNSFERRRGTLVTIRNTGIKFSKRFPSFFFLKKVQAALCDHRTSQHDQHDQHEQESRSRTESNWSMVWKESILEGTETSGNFFQFLNYNWDWLSCTFLLYDYCTRLKFLNGSSLSLPVCCRQIANRVALASSSEPSPS